VNKYFLTAIFAITLFFKSADTSLAANTAKISYTVTFPEAQAHYVNVEMHIDNIHQSNITLKMPVWTPGSYLVREYAKNVETFVVTADGKEIPFKKTRKNWWSINTTGKKSITIKYNIYCNEISVRTPAVDVSHAFLSTLGVFFYPEGMLHQPSTIHIIPYKGWTKVSTSLETVDNDIFTRHSPDYDILFDSPIEVGNQDVFGFDANGVKYEVAMYGGGNYDAERLKKDMAKIVETEANIYGENPNKHYTFIIHNYQRANGDLEHLSSTVLEALPDAYKNENKYQDFLSTVAHEHFHLWNVKRLRPIALGPFDYDNENYTTDLWIAEGFTAYYQDIVLRHAELIPADNYLKVLSDDINSVENTPGKKIQTVADASYDAWIKTYRPDENSVNSSISYYDKGSVIAMLLDLEIINDSKAKYSLDDVIHYMYNEYYKTKKRGYTDAEFKLGLEKFAGKNLDEFYKQYIYGLADIDYNKFLAYAGYTAVDENAATNYPSLGVELTSGSKKIVTTVLRNTAAWNDGINTGDEITAIDGNSVLDSALLFKDKKTGDKITVKINRNGLPITLPVTLLRNAQLKYSIESIPNPSAQQLKVRNKWLKL